MSIIFKLKDKTQLIKVYLGCLLFFNVSAVMSDETIVVSIPPLKFFMEKIVGDDVDVISLVPENITPEIFEPTPKQLLNIKNSQLYFSIGLPFEKKWLNVLSEDKNLVVNMDCCADLKTIYDAEHIHHHAADPHVWTDPLLILEIARRMKQQVSQLNPENKLQYQNNFENLRNELNQLDSIIKDTLLPYKNQTYLVTHPAWSYFAKRYGLIQLSLEHEGKDIGIKQRKIILEQADKNNIKHIFSVEKYSERALKNYAVEIGAEVIFINPLAYNYIDNLKYVTEQLTYSFQ